MIRAELCLFNGQAKQYVMASGKAQGAYVTCSMQRLICYTQILILNGQLLLVKPDPVLKEGAIWRVPFCVLLVCLLRLLI